MRAYHLTTDVMIVAGRAHFKGRYFGPKLIFAMLYCVLIGIAVAYLSDTTSLADFLTVTLGMTIIGILVFTIIIVTLYYWQIPRQARANHAMQPAFSLPYHVQWDNKEITLKSEKNHSTDAFGDFVAWSRAGEHVMLYRNKIIYNLIAAEAFETPEERDDLISKLVAAGVKQR
jgi:hypothetical protein